MLEFIFNDHVGDSDSKLSLIPMQQVFLIANLITEDGLVTNQKQKTELFAQVDSSNSTLNGLIDFSPLSINLVRYDMSELKFSMS